ncbi:putative Ig domain-containing protein [Moraxella sp. K127]|uniref:calcium-binding protein n=1 Tax=Moraxella sp. K127 TaxID=2780079 RepID=UPI0018819442|nr:calcium-binding protein [Moraxella sp. K127]MBE9591120.1 putative Ig domain-containing protein [Moraxella sp. K127]
MSQNNCETPWGQTLAWNAANSFVGAIDEALNKKSLIIGLGKVGNVYSIGTMLAKAMTGDHQGAHETGASFIGGFVAGAVVTALMGSALIPTLISIGTATYVSYRIDDYYNQKRCEKRDESEPYRPRPDESPTQGYIKKYYDPIILDLDGNGVGTASKFGYHGAMFDHDGDGVATATGWVDKSDGLLVRDVNGDGKINDGSELFGDNTRLDNGELATSGMEALADLDDNGDGVIDANDKAFAQLKVWQDKNGDGISSDDELMSLAELGIEKIDLNNKETVNKEVDGGIIKEQATFIKTDGSIHTLADVNFDADSIHTRHLNKVELSDEVKALPGVYGMGRLADIQQAAMKSDELADILGKYASATSRTAQKAMLDKLMTAWAKTDPSYQDSDILIMKQQNIRWTQSSQDDKNAVEVLLRPNEALPAHITHYTPPTTANDELKAKVKFIDAIMGISPTKHLYEINRSQTKIFEDKYNEVKDRLYHNLLNQTILKPYLEAIDVYTNGKEMVMDFGKFESMLLSKYQTHPLEALEDLKDLIKLNGGVLEVGGYEKAFALLQEWRDELSDKHNLKEYVDKMFADFDIAHADKSKLNNIISLDDKDDKTYNANASNDIIIINAKTGKTVHGGHGDDVIVSGVGDDYLSGGDGRNTYVFSKNWGKDFVHYDNTGDGYDKLVFTGGNHADFDFYRQNSNLIVKSGDNQLTLLGVMDAHSTKEVYFKFDDKIILLTEILKEPIQNLPVSQSDIYINGWRGSDILNGNANNNQLFGFDGHDVLIGGTGNDILTGGAGIDSYHFSLGDGIDTIIEEDYSKEASHIVFDDVVSDKIGQVIFNGNDLVIHYGDDDKIILKSYLNNSNNAKLSIGFADDSVWYHEDLMSKVVFVGGDTHDVITGTLDNHLNIIKGLSGNDTLRGNLHAINHIYGGHGSDTIYGGSNHDIIHGGDDNDTLHGNGGNDMLHGNLGNDFLYGGEGNDILEGDAGHDTLYGDEGDDILIGGDGNDWLEGGAGADTLIGGLGDDTYIVDEFDTYLEEGKDLEGGYDTIHIASDFDLSSNNFEAATLLGDGDFSVIGDEFDNIITANGGNNHLTGGLGNDTIHGNAGDDMIYGNEGNDTLDGGDGDDYLDGGTGIDEMIGGNGNDYYILDNEFDTVIEHFAADSGTDTLEQHIDRSFYNFDEFGNPIKTGSYHQLFDNVENLILKGEATKAFGNDLDNIITLNNKDNFVNALAGNDTIIYQKGGGRDTILSTDSLESKDTLAIHGYDLSEAMFVRVTNTASNHDMLQIRFKGTNDQITLIDYFAEQVEGFDNRMDEITFTKGGNTTTLSQSEFEAKIFAQTNNRTPWVNKHPRPIKGEIGKALSITFDKDTIKDVDVYDSELSYRLTLANMGADGQYEPLPDWLSFDPSTLTLTGTPPKEAAGNLQFILWGEDSFNHSAGTYVNLSIAGATVDKPTETSPLAPVAIGDTIKDTQGNDTLRGTTADNTFVYTKGIDTIIDKGGNDTLVFGNGITFNQVGSTLLMSGNDLILRVNGSTTNQVTLKDFFGSADSVIETIKFETGGQIDYKRIYELFGKEVPTKSDESALPPAVSPDVHDNAPLTISKDNHIIADARANKLYGTYGHDQLQGLAGADTLDGKAGHDILIGGSGNDRLIGGSGNDLYYFTKGFGKDTIVNTGGGYDNIYFDGISFNQVGRGLTKMNNDLILKVSGSTDELTIKDFFTGGDNADINISFADGGSISATELLGLFKSSKTATHTDIDGFNKALDVSLALMEEFKTLTTEGGTTII